jgi:hypothetical protein
MDIITISGHFILMIDINSSKSTYRILQYVLFVIIIFLVFTIIQRMDTDPASYGNLPNLFNNSEEANAIPDSNPKSVSISDVKKSKHTSSTSVAESTSCKKISVTHSDSTIIPRIQKAQQEGRPIVWVYFEYEVSARKWLNFYSRRSPQGMEGLLQLCLLTIRHHFPASHFEVIVYTQDDIEQILPSCYSQEYLHMRTSGVDSYLYRAYVRYALLYHYGGYSIPLDTIIAKPMVDTIADYRTGKCILFGPTSSIYNEWLGVDDARVAVTEGHSLVRDIIKFITENSRKFHYSMEFRDAISQKVQELVTIHAGLIRVNQCLPTVNSSGRPYLIDDLYASSWSMPQPDTPVGSYCMIPTHYQQAVRKYSFGYLRQLSAEEINQSELWVAEQIRRSMQK